MLKNDFIFVYGTLRQGERADLRKQSHNFGVDFSGKDKINGKMYHIGAFPGVKDVNSRFDPNDPTVVGEVFKIREQAITSLLDAYEGYNAEVPASGLYNRVQVKTQRGILVWVYTYNPPVFKEQLIEGGDWVRNRISAGNARQLREA